MTRRRSPLARAAAAIGLAALVVAGCSPGASTPDVERGIITAGDVLPEAGVDGTILPFPFQELPTFTLPFDAVPAHLDGILFGLREIDGALEFSAVTTAGRLLWTTQRPATCSGFTLSRAGDIPLAVLTDVGAGNGALETTASAYDLRNGDLVWGPVLVNGPWHGPGTVFAEAAPPSTMGETGERQLLDPATGENLDAGDGAIGEFYGTALTIEGDEMRAQGGASWSLPLSEVFTEAAGTHSNVTPLPGVHHPEGYALVTANNSPTGSVIDLRDGSVVTKAASEAVWDAAAGTLVVIEPGMLAGYGIEGPLWSRELRHGLRLSASGGVLTYLRTDTAVQVVNAVTGDDAVGYSEEADRYAVPALITPNGAAVFSLDNLVLASSYEAPEN